VTIAQRYHRQAPRRGRVGRTREAAMAPHCPAARVPRGERGVRSERTSEVFSGCTDEKVARDYTLNAAGLAARAVLACPDRRGELPRIAEFDRDRPSPRNLEQTTTPVILAQRRL
jgi:hypothetical protein